MLDAMRAAGHGTIFICSSKSSRTRIGYGQMRLSPFLASSTGPQDLHLRWKPGARSSGSSLYRKAPDRLPAWIEPDYLAHNIAEFQRTGFHGALNYYRAVQPFFDLSGAYIGAKIPQPSYFMWGKVGRLVSDLSPDGGNDARPPPGPPRICRP